MRLNGGFANRHGPIPTPPFSRHSIYEQLISFFRIGVIFDVEHQSSIIVG